MYWLFFALLSAFSLSVGTILQRVLMKDEDSNAFSYSIVFQFICTIIVGLFALWKGFVIPPIGQLLLNFVFTGILYGLGTLFLFKALQLIEASEITILIASRSLITVISAVLLLGEIFDLKKIVGTVFIFTSIILVSKNRHLSFKKGSLYAIGVVVCYGLAVTNDAYILRFSETFSYTTIGFLLPGIFLSLVKPAAFVEIKRFLHTKFLVRMIFMCIFYSVAAVSFYQAISYGANASQMGPINQSSVIITVLLAVIFLKEKDNLWKKISSALLVTIGVLLFI